MTCPAFRAGALALFATLGLAACAADPAAIPPNESRRGLSPMAGEPVAAMPTTPGAADASPAPTGRRAVAGDTAVSAGPATALDSAGASPASTGRASGTRQR
ncbi:hypothetical protein LPC08_05490 [Roseomonas sp. OT10]|uniref:hypothetical protein n=1 Tax=Roseomonas cutis TaxID=2897332 RepID=UPI001E459A47|nr:hypothetical protein [Roseomonas sp. OT10]UFN50087.1 hypothetical protein LPC08_05490 [Roseomonas sp. OT10]